MMLCIFLVPKNNILTIILGIPFERTLFWHKLFACISILIGAFHGFIVNDTVYLTKSGQIDQKK